MIYRCRKCTFVTQYRTSMEQHLLMYHGTIAEPFSTTHYSVNPITDALDSFDPAPYTPPPVVPYDPYADSSHCGQDSE